jgi:signal transduction histidine kinase
VHHHAYRHASSLSGGAIILIRQQPGGATVRTAEDIARVGAIADYRILGDVVEPSLESLARLAATLCGVSRAVVNIIDDRSQYQVAAVGFEADICSRQDSMCAVVLQDARHVLVDDARVDARFAANPFVNGELGRIRFYASSPLVTPGGISIGTLCVFADEVGTLTGDQSAALDLLARQAVEVLELRRITHELERSNDQLAQFAGRLSHDLRNPLTAVIGQLDLATEGLVAGDADRASRALSYAEAAATRMESTITGLLAFARIGGAHPRQAPTSLAGVVTDAVADLDAAIRAAHATVAVDVPGEAVVQGDSVLLEVLVQNLVANAVKFAAAAGVRPVIEMAAARDGDGWLLTLDDNGPGVPPELRERVFGIMERGEADGVPGLGLGLTTCRQIAEAHGGRISIEDAPLGGARIRVWLP